VRSRVLLPLVLAALAAFAGCDLGSDDEDSGDRQPEAGGRGDRRSAPPVKRLQRGGYLVVLRHAATDPTATDMTGNLRDCSRQRNLNAEGRRQARGIGRAFRRLGIPVGRVLASPFCRTRDTARLAFGHARPSRALLSADFFGDDTAAERQRAGLRRLLALPPRRGSNTVLVSHEAAIATATRVTVAEGEAVIVAPGRGRRRFQIVTTVEADAWDRSQRP
jgi:phosphohistidine phosphatase SixA